MVILLMKQPDIVPAASFLLAMFAGAKRVPADAI
jgi:hypothetical protein